MLLQAPCGLTEQVLAVQSEMDMVTLPTLLPDANVTIMTDEVNSTEVFTVVSFASEATIVTPAAFACNVSQLLSNVVLRNTLGHTTQQAPACNHPKSSASAYTCCVALNV